MHETRNAAFAEAHAESREGLDNPGLLGARKLSELEHQGGSLKLEQTPPAVQIDERTDEQREIDFLLAYCGNDPNLLWRKANAVQLVARERAATERRERCELSLANDKVERALADVNSKIETACVHAEAQSEAIAQVIAHERKLWRAEIDKARSGEVIDLPNPLRSVRRAG